MWQSTFIKLINIQEVSIFYFKILTTLMSLRGNEHKVNAQLGNGDSFPSSLQD